MQACQLLLFSSSVSCCHGERCSSKQGQGMERDRERASAARQRASRVRPRVCLCWSAHVAGARFKIRNYGSNRQHNPPFDWTEPDNIGFLCWGGSLKKVLLALFSWRWNFGSWTDVILCEQWAVLADLRSYCFRSLPFSLVSSEPTNRNLA